METESNTTTVQIPGGTESDVKLHRFFVYGIFLAEEARRSYGMIKPDYATVPGYITVGDYIVQAMPTDRPEVQLTGLTVWVPDEFIRRLDLLESGYDRVRVTTSSGEEVFMYVRPQSSLKNHSFIR